MLSRGLSVLPCLLIAVALAQNPLEVVEPEAPEVSGPPVATRSLGLHFAPNGLVVGLEWQHGPVMGFVSGTLGIPGVQALTAGPYSSNIGSIVVGLGYTRPLSKPGPSMWFFDVFGELMPCWDHEYFDTYAHLGFGVGIGLRYLHASGFTFGLKLPLLGGMLGGLGELGPATSPLAASTTLFYAFNGIGLPLISFGYRWDVGT